MAHSHFDKINAKLEGFREHKKSFVFGKRTNLVRVSPYWKDILRNPKELEWKEGV